MADNLNTDSSNTKNRIMETTIQLLRESCDHKITVAKICKEAGITKSTFYYHFNSADQIIEYFLSQIGNTVQENMPNILILDTHVEQILTIFEILDDRLVIASPAVAAYRYSYLLKEPNNMNFPKNETTWKIVTSLVKKAQDSGEIMNTNDPEDIAATCYFVSRGICTTWAMEDGGFDLITKIRKSISLVLMPASSLENNNLSS